MWFIPGRPERAYRVGLLLLRDRAITASYNSLINRSRVSGLHVRIIVNLLCFVL